MVSRTSNVVHIILFSSTFLYMKGLHDCDYTQVLYFMYDCVRKWLCTYLGSNYINKYMNTRTSKYFTSEVLKGFFLPFTSVSNVLHLSNFRHTLFCTYFLCCILLMLFGPVQSDVPSDFVFPMFSCV